MTVPAPPQSHLLALQLLQALALPVTPTQFAARETALSLP